MKNLLFISVLFFLIVSGCKLDDSVISPSPSKHPGQILLKFDKTSIPSGITQVTAILSRSGFNPISGNLNILSDSTAEIYFQNIAVGIWHLLVQAKDSLNVVRFAGETDVNILENQVTQVSLTLVPTTTGTGGIHIVVNWGILGQNQWRDYQNNPVLSSSNSSFDYAGVSHCRILLDNNRYRIYYLGLINSGIGYILYAESLDGISWVNPLSSPVLFPGDFGTWDSRAVGPNAIIKEGNLYRLYYRGTNENGISHVGLATSTDGINFTKHPTPVLYSIPGQEDNIGSHSLVKINGIYHLYYAASSGYSSNLRIYLATSVDGINWTRFAGNPILTKTQNWEGDGVTSASVIYVNNQFKMIYQMYANNDTAFGMAISNDGKNWTKSNANPVFTSKKTYNNWASSIDHPFLMRTGNEYRLYYSGVKNSSKYNIGFARKNQL